MISFKFLDLDALIYLFQKEFDCEYKCYLAMSINSEFFRIKFFSLIIDHGLGLVCT